MNYTYEFMKIRPKDLFVQIKYSADDSSLPDIFRNIITDDFTEEGLNAKAQQYAIGVIEQWNKSSLAPEEVVLSENVKQVTYKPELILDRPNYDPFTQKLEPFENETEFEIEKGWNVVNLTAEEKETFLQEWRSGAQVSMRQARLALIQENLLASVNSAIQNLQEPEKTIVETEWEYAAVVDRNSPWMGLMAAQLGLTDEQMDNLFKLAFTL